MSRSARSARNCEDPEEASEPDTDDARASETAKFILPRRMQGLQPTLIRQFFERALPDSINFGLGEPDLPTPQFMREEAARIAIEEQNGYTSHPGIPALRTRSPSNIRISDSADDGRRRDLRLAGSDDRGVSVPRRRRRRSSAAGPELSRIRRVRADRRRAIRSITVCRRTRILHLISRISNLQITRKDKSRGRHLPIKSDRQNTDARRSQTDRRGTRRHRNLSDLGRDLQRSLFWRAAAFGVGVLR